MTESSGRTEIERRIVSVLFCDLAGFTSLSERLDAEDIAIVQAAYFEAVRDAVARHGGTLEKFIGDAAVAVYGMPVAREDDAQRAVRTGLAIVSAVEQLAGAIGLDEEALQVRVGVQTGEAVVHTDPRAGEALVTGDVVNTAARLQAAAPLGAVLVGADTALAVTSAVELEDLGELDLKGKAAPVPVSRVISILAEPERERAMGGLGAATVGRDDELAGLAAALEECARGRSTRVTIVAPPGTGKSRMLQEVAALAAAAGADVRTARVRPDGLAPFRPVAELVAAALGSPRLGPEDGAVRRRLESRLGRERGGLVAGELAAVLAGYDEPASAHDAEIARTMRFAAWSDGLRALGDGSPEVWLVEDVHWATPDFRAFVGESGRQEGSRGRLVVSTARPSLLESDADWIASSMLMILDPLQDEAAGELVRELVGDALDEELVRGIVERSGGNPLFVEELLRTWVSTGLLEPAAGGWRVRGGAAEIELPSTVQTIYAAQLDDLPATARDLVRRASVAGRRFPVAALRSLGAEGQNGLETLERRGIVRGPVADPVLGESYVFRHALLRDVGYASLSRTVRAHLHVRMARWLECVAHEHPVDVAEVTGRHYAAAIEAAPQLVSDLGDGLSRPDAARLASGWFERAGEDALAIAAYDTAEGLFERALELTAPEDEISRARRLVGLAQSVAFTSDMDAGLEAAREALALARASFRAGGQGCLRDDVSRAGSLVGRIYTQQLRFADAMELAADLLAELGERNDPATMRLLLLRIRGAGMISDEAWDAVAAERRRVRELAPVLGDAELALEARMTTAWDEADCRAAWTEIEQLAQALRRWPAVAEARQALAGVCLPDDLDGTRDAAARLASFAAAHQLHESRAWGAYYVAEAEFASGRWDEALEAGLLALELAEEGGYQRAAARTWFAVLPIVAARRDRATVERAAAWYERLQSFPDSPYGRISRTASDILLCGAGLPSTFRVPLEDLGASIAEGGSLPSWFEAVDVVVADALATGRVEAACDAVETFRGTLADGGSATAAATLALLQARVHSHAGRTVSSSEFLSSLREHGRPWPLLKCLRLHQGRGLAGPGEAEEARALEARLGL